MADQYEAVSREAGPVAAAINQAADQSRNETEFRSEVHHILRGFAERTRIELDSRQEYSVAAGRPDAVYNRVVIEYKSPGKLSTRPYHRCTDDAILQLKGYLDSLQSEIHGKDTRLAGVLLDGKLIAFIRVFAGSWVADQPVPVTPTSVERLLRFLVSLGTGRALVAENLADDFGIETDWGRNLILALYNGAESTTPRIVPQLFHQWELYFTEVAGYEVGSSKFLAKEGTHRLLGSLHIQAGSASPARLFFALHTYFAIMIKLVAWLAVSPYVSKLGTPFSRLSQIGPEELAVQLRKLERGGIFRELGIRNFLEADFFGWYLEVWSPEIASAVHQVISRLSDYDPGSLELNPEGTRDLLKKLYQYLMPKEARHDLGEYYTPDWLAQLALNRLESADATVSFKGDPECRILDPACGSGTFLVLAINAIKRRCEALMLSPSETLERILTDVVGIDLNPLAVIAARTNYLLAIQELLEHRRGEISIPVYLADSVLLPSPAERLEETGRLRIQTAVGPFAVPVQVASSERIDPFMTLLDECIETESSCDTFLTRVKSVLDPEEFRASRDGLSELYVRIEQLHRDGLNGIWSRILKNAFAPLFIGRDFDFVAGNPPWVNWESLPDRYREETKRLWIRYGLFPHSGMDTILGKGKKDISMLMTYAVADRHLKIGGKLAFVVTQTLFKSASAAQGFRRFSLGEKGDPLRVLMVDDLVDLSPFEGAANRTSLVVFEKGAKTEYPVGYLEWKQADRRIPFESTLRDAIASSRTTLLAAEPIDPNDPTSPWITASRSALRVMHKIIGKSEYVAHAGVYSGGANGVYWVRELRKLPGNQVLVRNVTEGQKRDVAEVEGALETRLLYPLVRGRDVSRWRAEPSLQILMVQDPATRKGIDVSRLQTENPNTYRWLKQFESQLRDRAAFRRYFQRPSERNEQVDSGPFYSMFNVSEYTFAPWKVVWREQASEFTAAVIGSQNDRVTIPDHKLMMVGLQSEDEAYFLCGLLNSSLVRAAVGGYVIETNMDTHILEHIAVPRYDSATKGHSAIAKLSRRAHSAASREGDTELTKIESELNDVVSELFGLSRSDRISVQ